MKLLWQTTAYAGALNGIAVGDSTVVVTNQAPFSSTPSVHGLDQSSGAILWSHAFGPNNDTTSPPAYAHNNKLFYVQSDGNSSGGNFLNAFDPASGTTIFSAPYSDQWENILNPTPYNGVIYTGGGYYGGMYSFNGITGIRTGLARCRNTMAGRQPSMESMPVLTPAAAI